MMTGPSLRILTVLTLWVSVTFAPVPSAVAQTVEPTVITLKKSVDVRHDIVVLGDVADIDGPSALFVKRLKGIDLTVLKTIGESQTITSRQARARLLLEGVDRRSVQFAGADSTQVILAPHSVAIPEQKAVDYQADVLAQAVEALAKAWLADPEDIHIEVLSTQTGMLAKDGSQAIPELDLPTRLEPGRIQARLRWTHQNKVERVEQISFDARLRQTIVLAAQNITRGEQLTPQNMVQDRRLLSTRVQQVKAEEIVGCVAKRSVTQGDMLLVKDLTAPKTFVQQVGVRDGVRVVARKGGLTVVLQMAEVLQAGQVGDLVRVRNLESGKVISAKVVSSNEVEVPLH